jgi:hypothetical protein
VGSGVLSVVRVALRGWRLVAAGRGAVVGAGQAACAQPHGPRPALA